MAMPQTHESFRRPFPVLGTGVLAARELATEAPQHPVAPRFNIDFSPRISSNFA
jgi:hypothetical protein